MLACADKQTTSTKITDADLERAIENRLNEAPQLNKLKVSANAAKNEATLSGTVATEALRTRATELAKAASPNLVLTDKIDVKPVELTRNEYTEDMARDSREKARANGDKVGTSVDDAWIHTKVSAKLMADPDTPFTKINVDVDNGVVTLRGDVKSREAKSEAERLAKSVDGVKRVSNRLQVRTAAR
jgi:osmotically-inducible protein OsmY